jgi:hypothetical protein
MIGTKNYFTNEFTHIKRSQEVWTDLGYSLDIPWNSVYTVGWQDGKPAHSDGVMWGTENKLSTRNDPEYWAAGNIVRSNIIPEINVHDPIYAFSRAKYTFTV